MELVITSLGLVSSVGHDVITTCASIRAGLNCHQPLHYFHALDDDMGLMEPVIGHPIRVFTEGFSIIGRWLRLAQGSIRDLLRHGELPARSEVDFWRMTGLLAVTPYHNDERLQNDEDTSLEDVRRAYLEPLRKSLALPIAAEQADVLCLGQAGAVWAIHQAGRWMSSRGLERLLIVAADSYCDPLTLDWLAGHRRLKTADNPCGLAPGEAGAAFLLETLSSARRRQPRMMLPIDGVAVGIEENHLFSRKPNVGVGLSAALSQTLSVMPAFSPFMGDIVSDLNGENWRARELGHVRVRLAERLGEGARLLLPALSLGDTGAASGAVSVCVAARALVRGYARAERVLVVSSSERGHVGTLSLGRSR